MHAFYTRLLGLSALAASAAMAAGPMLPMPSATPPGSPGTPTPTPYQQVVPYDVPSVSPRQPPLLNNGDIRPPAAVPPPSRDQDLPLLQEQRQRNLEGAEPERPPKAKARRVWE
ncbi:hypothetical protein D3880_15480 [Pseudomonas cavernae]|uniref:Uncharacterized protein n=1 Tax=Pseudomonas cavernae TaxID=2320867 RepID=A0A385Z4R1_9PSED|nr:hypothetical protein [Pseudomonas cavernae]AYC33671.1 hypothetical protein D3880_15480 [Pseudomonas cavernae]